MEDYKFCHDTQKMVYTGEYWQGDEEKLIDPHNFEIKFIDDEYAEKEMFIVTYRHDIDTVFEREMTLDEYICDEDLSDEDVEDYWQEYFGYCIEDFHRFVSNELGAEL